MLKLSLKNTTGKNQSSKGKQIKVKEPKEEAKVSHEETKDFSAENRTKKRVQSVINIISQIFSVISISPALFNCFVKARILEALEIVDFFLHI